MTSPAEGERFPYESFRPGQREVAEAVKKAFEAGELLVLKAPTGFGKTAAVIHGARLSGAEKILYLVRTVNELDPVVRELKRFGEDFTVLFSARRSCPLMTAPGRPPPPAEDFWGNCRIARLRGLCSYYEKLLKEGPERARLRLREAPVISAMRLARDIGFQDELCPFFSLAQLVEDSRFIVATYPYFFRKDIFEMVFSEYSYSDLYIIVDEAHSLVEAHSLAEARITVNDLKAAVAEAKKYASEAVDAVERLEGLTGFLEAAAPERRGSVARASKEDALKILGDVDVYEDLAEEIRGKKLEEALASGGSLSEVRTYTARIAAWTRSLSMEESYLFVEKGEKGEIVAVATPMDPAVIVKEPLEAVKAAVLMSGTLPPEDYAAGILGLERSHVYLDAVLHLGARSPASNMYVVVVADVTTLYRKRSPDMYHRIASYITAVHRALPGLTLAVYPSYEVMEEIVKRLPIDLELVIETRATNLADVETKILSSEEDLLVNAVAGGKLVEGVEFVDYEGRNLLRKVAVVGVPFPQPDEYTKAKLEALSRRLGEQRAKRIVYLYSVAVKVRQAVGRSVRSPEDRAAVFLLDYRFLRRDIKELLDLRYNSVARGMEGLEKALARARIHLTQ